MAERPPTRRLRWGPRLVRLGLSAVFVSGVAALVLLVATVWAWDRAIVRSPGVHIDRQHIRSIIAQESPVTFADGTTRVGVFFEAEHRRSVGWDDMPLAYVMGIVAAEDQRFWRHHGVDAWGILRAMRDNLRARRVVAGGSTLTQQTAKNLYYRPDRSLRSKLIEVLNALRLEAHYDKAEILGFYANQFHVTGNGRGLGIAARHFFDKEADELTVLECAFLAGMVKAPGHVDPTLGDEARRTRAVERAHERARYVLGRMVAVPGSQLARPDADPAEVARVQAEARRLLDEGFALKFRRGTFRYDSSAVLDEVARRLAEPPFDEVLEEAGVDDPSTAGLVVVTTLDPVAQRAATYALWHHLTEVGAWMEELGPGAFVRGDSRGPPFEPDFPPVAHEFRLGRVTARSERDGKGVLELDLGGHACTVDRDGIVRAALASWRGKQGNRSVKIPTKEVDAFLESFVADDVVWISVRDAPAGAGAVCDLEVRPELQGSVMVVEDGRIRAMVGGNDNRNFNRATALRQMGSTWKPLVYHAAFQLGWHPDDPLDNRRNVFPFSTTFYAPKPDHEPPPEVSMAWAGVHSENIASVWLLYHLTDRLDGEQVRELADSLGLARGDDESEEDYRLRIQTAGVLPTRQRVSEGLFLQARQAVVEGIDRSDHPEDRVSLMSLLYGWGFDRQRARLTGHARRALDHAWLRLEPMIDDCVSQHGRLQEALLEGRMPSAALTSALTVRLDGDTIQVACGEAPEDHVAPDGAFLTSLRQAAADTRLRLDRPEDMRVGGRLHLSTLSSVREALRRRELALSMAPEQPDLYDPDLLYHHQDFRVLLSLRYLASLAEQYGVQTDLPQVLAMPLGASEVTLEEMVSVYQGIVSGNAWSFPGRAGTREVVSPPTPALLIAEIRDVDGRVLYQVDPEATRIAPAQTGELTADILRNVVRWGTGRRADLAVRVGGAAVPVGGKTGTTNDFRNAAFVGFAPRWSQGGFPTGGYSVGVYVGYDDNRPMVRRGIRLAGASGALPAWIDTLTGMADGGLLGAPDVEAPPAGRWASPLLPGLVRIPVHPEGGLALDPFEALEPDGPTVAIARRAALPEHLRFEPFRRPPRIAPRTDEPHAMPPPRRPWGHGRPSGEAF